MIQPAYPVVSSLSGRAEQRPARQAQLAGVETGIRGMPVDLHASRLAIVGDCSDYESAIKFAHFQPIEFMGQKTADNGRNKWNKPLTTSLPHVSMRL